MNIDSKDYRVPPDKKVGLAKWPTVVDPYYKSKKQYQELLTEHMEKLSSLQQLHYASNRHALLLIFQGMDGAGKDGAIRHVMSGVNPEGCEVFSFKQPSAEELEHDFLWRTIFRLPERGRIGIFNRSYYEEVLVVRVHPELLNGEGLSEELRNDKNIWTQRYRCLADIHERKFWTHYMEPFQDCLNATSTEHSPWYVVPADDKDNARLIISSIVLDAMKSLKLSYPKTTAK